MILFIYKLISLNYFKIHNFREPQGGSNYGAGTFAGLDGKRQVTDLEKKVAEIQGIHIFLSIL